MQNNKVYILGASGHGKVVLGILRALQLSVTGFYDDASVLWDTFISGIPVCGSVSDFVTTQDSQVIIAIGNNTIRKKIASFYPETNWMTLVHPASWVDSTSKLGTGTIVCAGAIVQPDVNIGMHCIINTGACVDHDCQVEDFTHICPGVHMGGGVHIGGNSWIGIGSQIIQNIRIGKNVLIGAGSTIVRDIPDNAVVMGTPGRIVRYQS